jgi:hypothetical protein
VSEPRKVIVSIGELDENRLGPFSAIYDRELFLPPYLFKSGIFALQRLPFLFSLEKSSLLLTHGEYYGCVIINMFSYCFLIDTLFTEQLIQFLSEGS